MQFRICNLLPSLSPCLLLICLSLRSTGQIIDIGIPPDVLASELLSNNEAASNCEIACLVLTDLLPGSVFVGQTGDFDFWDAKQREIVPACRIEPANADDIATILKTVITHDCHFAVKSGGHERAVGASNAKNGVTIDLVRLKQLDISSDQSTVTLGPGWRWQDVYAALEPHGIIVLGGRIGDVGVGGLLLGGGISYYSNQHGLACDSILSYTILFPNLTHATITPSHPLHRALRGTGPMNYGIITSFTLRAWSSSHRLWTGNKAFHWHKSPQLLAINHHTTTTAMNTDPGISVMFIHMCYPLYSICISNIISQHTTHTDNNTWPESMALYGELEGLERSERLSVRSFARVVNDMDASKDGSRHRTIYATMSYSPDVRLEQELLGIFREESEREGLKDLIGFVPGMIMHPLSARCVEKMQQNGGNAFWKGVGGGPVTILNIAIQWDERGDDERVYQVYRTMMERLEGKAKEMGLWRGYKYLNYAEAEQDVWEGYGEQIEVFRKLQREVDPEGVFAKGGLAGGVFKLNEKRGKVDENDGRMVKDEL